MARFGFAALVAVGLLLSESLVAGQQKIKENPRRDGKPYNKKTSSGKEGAKKPLTPPSKPTSALIAAAAAVKVPRSRGDKSKMTFRPMPTCTNFDECLASKEEGDATVTCCKESFGDDTRSCGICLRTGCTLRADSCRGSQGKEDKYCGHWYTLADKLAQEEQLKARRLGAKDKAADKKGDRGPRGNPFGNRGGGKNAGPSWTGKKQSGQEGGRGVFSGKAGRPGPFSGKGSARKPPLKLPKKWDPRKQEV